MKLNLKTDYALRVLIYLQNKDKATIAEIATFYSIKKNHLSVIVNRLSELGYLNTVSGPKGGISLKSKALKKSIAEIVLQFEDFDLVECFKLESDQCRISPKCRLKTILKKANKEFVNELKNHTLQDLKLSL